MNRIRNRNRNRSQRLFLPLLERAESRELMTGAPLQFQSGAAFSHPNQVYYEIKASNPEQNISWVGATSVMTTLDIYGNPIDFNNDGFSDMITYGSMFEYIGLGSDQEPLIAGARGPASTVLISTGSNFDSYVGTTHSLEFLQAREVIPLRWPLCWTSMATVMMTFSV